MSTPRTDAELMRIEADEKQFPERFDCYLELAKFARQLETELLYWKGVVRGARADLHEKGQITDDDYAALCLDTESRDYVDRLDSVTDKLQQATEQIENAKAAFGEHPEADIDIAARIGSLRDSERDLFHRNTSLGERLQQATRERDEAREALRKELEMPAHLLDVHAIADQRDSAVAERDALRAERDAAWEAAKHTRQHQLTVAKEHQLQEAIAVCNKLETELQQATRERDEARQMVDAKCSLLANIGDTCRSRGFDADIGQMDERVIMLAKQNDALRALVEKLKTKLATLDFITTQATECGKCGKFKHTPWRDSEHGYICATCFEQTARAEVAELRKDKERLIEALDCLSLVVCLTAIKHESQLAPLQEANNQARNVLIAMKGGAQ